MPSNDPRLTKAQRRDEARAKALQLKKEQEARAKRNRLFAIGGLALAVIALIVVVVLVVTQDKATKEAYSDVAYGGTATGVTAPALADVTAPSTANDTGGIPVSDEGVGVAGDGDVTVDVFLDFMCPYCGLFDRTNAADLDSLVAGGGVTVVYHPVNILDSYSAGSSYSTRAANAAATIADASPEQFTAFMTAMFADGTQPTENTTGLTDAKIAEIAQGVGVASSVTDTFTDTVDGTFTTSDSDTEQSGTWRTFAPWLAAVSDSIPVNSEGNRGTPTLLINGERWDGNYTTAGAFAEAVEAAKG